MKRIIFLVLALCATTVYANCYNQPVIRPDGSIMICQTCCDGGTCVTQCV